MNVRQTRKQCVKNALFWRRMSREVSRSYIAQQNLIRTNAVKATFQPLGLCCWLHFTDGL